MLIRTKEPMAGAVVEITPLVDMVFLLLIFFLVATTFQQAEREMQIALPAASSSGPISLSLRELIINVDAQGAVIVGGREVDEADLRTIIREAVAINPQQKVTVRGDRATAYANVIKVLDACKGSGIQEPYLDTVSGS